MIVKRFIVRMLSRLCAILDRIPVMRRHGGRWHLSTAQWGCWPLGLAQRSAELDERWGTGVWRSVTPCGGCSDPDCDDCRAEWRRQWY